MVKCACGSSLSFKDVVIKNAIRELGFETLNPKQRDAVQSFLSGNYMLVFLPTGYGKSIIYAAFPLIFDKLRGTNKNIVTVVS